MIDMEVRKRDFIAATKQLGGRKFLIGFTVRLNQLKISSSLAETLGQLANAKSDYVKQLDGNILCTVLKGFHLLINVSKGFAEIKQDLQRTTTNYSNQWDGKVNLC